MIDENQMFEMMLKQNLRSIAMFHQHVDSALKDRLSELDETDEIGKDNKNFWKREYKVNYPEKLRETAFLLMFGHLEEMLFLLWRDKNPNAVPLDRGHGIPKFNPYIEDRLGDLQQNADYAHILDAQKMRNSFLHTGGRVSLSRKREALSKIIKKYPYYRIEMDRIKIDYEGLSALQKAISRLTRASLNKSIQPTANASTD